MLIEEIVASEKMCPQRANAVERLSHCSGAGCMAWRWHGKEGAGYCGLAGRPDAADAQVKATDYMLTILPMIVAKAGIEVAGADHGE